MPLKKMEKCPSFSVISKCIEKLLYSKQVKFSNVIVIHDIHMIKIYKDSAMQNKIHNLALPSCELVLGNHKVTREGEWCFVSESSEESLKIMLCLHDFLFPVRDRSPLHLPNLEKWWFQQPQIQITLLDGLFLSL